MDTETDTIDNQLFKLFAGPVDEQLSGELIFDDNTFIVFEDVKRKDLLYIKEYIETMRVKDIEIQTYDGSSENI
jgi:hypothetical protein